MTEKKRLIQQICQHSQGERPELLANWSEEELVEYLNHLLKIKSKKLAFCHST